MNYNTTAVNQITEIITFKHLLSLCLIRMTLNSGYKFILCNTAVNKTYID